MNEQLRSAPDGVNKDIYETLVAAARRRVVLSYSQVGPTLHLNFESPADRNRIGHLLGEISRYEHAERSTRLMRHGRPDDDDRTQEAGHGAH